MAHTPQGLQLPPAASPAEKGQSGLLQPAAPARQARRSPQLCRGGLAEWVDALHEAPASHAGRDEAPATPRGDGYHTESDGSLSCDDLNELLGLEDATGQPGDTAGTPMALSLSLSLSQPSRTSSIGHSETSVPLSPPPVTLLSPPTGRFTQKRRTTGSDVL
eukprot:EG_transcript_15765